jgi:hypothetical protein
LTTALRHLPWTKEREKRKKKYHETCKYQQKQSNRIFKGNDQLGEGVRSSCHDESRGICVKPQEQEKWKKKKKKKRESEPDHTTRSITSAQLQW